MKGEVIMTLELNVPAKDREQMPKITIGFELEFCGPVDITCPDCEGTGRYEYTCGQCDGYGETDCPECEGTGEIEEDGEVKDCPECGGSGVVECPECEGTGSFEDYCERCGGSGRVDDAYEYFNGEFGDLSSYGQVTTDSSINPDSSDELGLEFRSEILYMTENNVQYIEDYVRKVIREIVRNDGYSNPWCTCGLHVHVGIQGGWTHRHAWNLANAWYSWAETEFMDEFPINDNRISYCCPWTDYQGFEPRSDVERIEKIGPGDRYATLNYRSYRSHGTIEFRMFNGTTDHQQILKAIKWVTALVLATYERIDGAEERFYNYLAPVHQVQVA
jgi:hypothetical protein